MTSDAMRLPVSPLWTTTRQGGLRMHDVADQTRLHTLHGAKPRPNSLQHQVDFCEDARAPSVHGKIRVVTYVRAVDVSKADYLRESTEYLGDSRRRRLRDSRL